MKVAEYTGRLLVDGNLELPPNVRQEMHLSANVRVKVRLEPFEETRPNEKPEPRSVDLENMKFQTPELQALYDLGKEFAKMDFNLTEHLIQSRREDDPD